MSNTRGPSDDELGSACRRLFDRLETTLVLLSIPPEVQCGIARRFRGAGNGHRGLDSSRLMVAVPKLDSAMQPVVSGLRSGSAPSANRQLVYAAQPAEIAINVHCRSGCSQLDLSGQVFRSDARDDVHYEATLLRGAEETATVMADELGEFSFQGISPGDYHVLLCSDTAEVMIVPLRMND